MHVNFDTAEKNEKFVILWIEDGSEIDLNIVRSQRQAEIV